MCKRCSVQFRPGLVRRNGPAIAAAAPPAPLPERLYQPGAWSYREREESRPPRNLRNHRVARAVELASISALNRLSNDYWPVCEGSRTIAAPSLVANSFLVVTTTQQFGFRPRIDEESVMSKLRRVFRPQNHLSSLYEPINSDTAEFHLNTLAEQTLAYGPMRPRMRSISCCDNWPVPS